MHQGIWIAFTGCALCGVAGADVFYNGHTYRLTDKAESWTSAQLEATSAGGTLVVINDAAEQAFLVTSFESPLVPYRPLWIGLQRTPPVAGLNSNPFSEWVDGTPLSYTNWQPGEPNNFTGNNQPQGEAYACMGWHAAQGVTSDAGKWNDSPNGGNFGFGGNTDGPYFGIIEIVPAPGSAALLSMGAVIVSRRRR